MIYETTDIKLGAAILAEILETFFVGISKENCVGTKRPIKITYSEEYAETLKKLIGDYERKVLMVNLYEFNRALFLIRNALFGRSGHNGNGLRERKAGGATRR
ncbi:MAG: hypothetical protein NG740_01025 [Omnitrophica bacterium]|nr:hypothetical protein [Candidatus Omnitrophota bacterium]